MRPGMTIEFEYDIEKAIHAMAYLVDRLGQVEKVKLMKLLYLADRDHFVEHGVPITRDTLYALPFGPVPSRTLDVLNGQYLEHHNRVFEYLHVDDNNVSCRAKPGVDALTDTEKKVLDRVIAEFGATSRWRLVRQTHELPEYKEVFREGTSTRIPYEIILKHHGGERRYRHGRPVISPKMAAHIVCPFPQSEPDL